MFDPYRDWLGITQPHRPLDGYSLLGLPLFEARPEVISAAVEKQLARVQQLQGTAYAAWVPNLTKEITVARNCLLSATKQQYDEALRRAMQPQQQPVAARTATVQELLPPTAPDMERPKPEKPAEKPADEKPKSENKPGLGGPLLRASIGGVILVALLVCIWQIGAMFSKPVSPSEDITSADQIPGPEANPVSPEQPMTPPPDEEVAPPPRKSTEPVLLNQEGNGEIQFTPITAEISGGIELISRGTDSVLGNWTSPDDGISWQFRLRKADIFRVQITYSTPPEWEGARIQVAIDDELKERTTRSGGSADKTVADEFFAPITKAGNHRLTLRMIQKPGEQAMILHHVRLIPTKQRQ